MEISLPITQSPMKALFPTAILTASFFLTILSPAWGSDQDATLAIRSSKTISSTEAPTRWRSSTYRARPGTSIGVSISTGPGPYYHRTRDYYPYYPSYGGPVYVTPPPVVYAPPPVVYSAPPVYYGNSVPPPRYEYAPPPPAPMVDTRLLQVQENLRRLGYYKGSVDGINGPGTRNAIRAYQVDRGLAVTGRVDRDLLQDLGL